MQPSKLDLAKLDRLFKTSDPRESCSIGEFSKAKDASIEFRNEIMAMWPQISRAIKAGQRVVTIVRTDDVYGPGSAELDAAADEFTDAMEGRR